MTPINPIERVEQINRICDEFEDLLIRGESPQAEQFLAQAESSVRTELLTELVRLELSYTDADNLPDIETYYQRFPDSRDAVVQAFDSTSNAVNSETIAELPEVLELNRLPGQLIGQYKIEEQIGSGGFADVYTAMDTRRHRQVALKVMKPVSDPSGAMRWHPKIVDSFTNEAKLLAGFQHSGIAQIYELDTDDNDLPYVVMEHIKGDSFKYLINEKLLEPGQGIRFIADVAEVLAAIHQQDVYHRDLKPANIIVGLDGRPKIVDFGLAVRESVQHLQAGEVSGSLSYMSPEQIRGRVHRLDGRADIWALGVILYELLTDRLPFKGPTPLIVADEILSRDPRPIRQINEQVSSRLEEICFKALEKDPRQRYSSAKEFADDLRAEWQSFEKQTTQLKHHASTAQGRAELRLANQAAIWNEHPESRRLPSPIQYLQILSRTRRQGWSRSESKMMNAAARFYALRSIVALLVIAAMFVLGKRIATTATRSAILDTLAEVSVAEDRAKLDAIAHGLASTASDTIDPLLNAVRNADDKSDNELFFRYLYVILNDQFFDVCLKTNDEFPRRLEGALQDIVNRRGRLFYGLESLWPKVEPQAVAAVQEHSGVLNDRLALATDLTRYELEQLDGWLGDSNFRLVDVHRFDNGDNGLHSAVWHRDPILIRQQRKTIDECLLVEERATRPNVHIQDVFRPDFFSKSTGVNGLVEFDWASVNVREVQQTRSQKYVGQLKFANSILESDQSSTPARFMKARALFYLNEFEQALSELNRLQDKSAIIAEAAYFQELKAMTLARLGDRSKALAELERMDVGKTTKALIRSKIFAFLGDYAVAEQHLESIGKGNIAAAQGRSLLAEIYSNNNDADHSKRNLKEALRLIALLPQRPTIDLKLVESPDFQFVRDNTDITEYLFSSDAISYSGVWDLSDSGYSYFSEGHSKYGLEIDEHIEVVRNKLKLVARGYLPVSVKALIHNGRIRVASIWNKPSTSAEELSEIQTAAIVTAARLKIAVLTSNKQAHQDTLRLLKHRNDNTFPTELIHYIGRFGIDVKSGILDLLEQFDDEPSVQQQMLNTICLYENTEIQLCSEAISKSLVRLEEKSHDVGVLASIRALRTRTGLASSDSRNAKLGALDGGVELVVNSLGQTMVCTNELWVAATEVTDGQFSQMFDDIVSNNQTAAVNVSFYEAARFCNWLSEREGIPREQWCYLPNEDEQYGPGMIIRHDFRKRTGYRLPTTDEFVEFSQGGSIGDKAHTRWFHGSNANRLSSYAWFYPTRKTKPVASLLPNRLGLFDTLGNAFETTMNPRLFSKRFRKDVVVVDETLVDFIGGSSWAADSDAVVRDFRRMKVLDYVKKQSGFRVVRSTVKK